SLLEPSERLLVVAEAKIYDNERCRCDIAMLLATFQFRENSQSVGATARTCVGRPQHVDEARTMVCTRTRLFQQRKCFVCLAFEHESKPEEPKAAVIVRVHR